MQIQRFLIDSKQPTSFQRTITNVYSEARVANLGDNSGDVLIQLESKTVLIEVKECPGDFISSIVDKRLFRQSEGIRSITPFAFLLLSHDFTYDGSSHVMGMSATGYSALPGWTRDHIDGALTAVQARGVMVRTAYKGYVEAIRLILNWVDTCDVGAITTEPIRLSPFDKDDQGMVNLLAWFDGIGVKQAKSFIEWAGRLPRYKLFELATTPFEGDDRPHLWTNHTIERNREQLEYPKEVKPRTEFLEELDIG